MQVLIRLSTVMVFFALAQAVSADSHRLQPDFTFKRVGVPSGTAGGRITVQMTPVAVQPTIPQDSGSSPTSNRASDVMAWFWDDVSPDLSATGPGRLAKVLETLRNAPRGKTVAVPSLDTLQRIATAHGRDILRETVGTDVSPALVLALIAIESTGQIEAESTAGAQGLMQLMPATAERFGVTDRLTPSENIRGGVAYLAWLMDHFDNDPVLALAGYNAGEGAVRDNAGVPPYAETRAYVPKVLAAWSVARGLCSTQPELITDGCVFSVGG